jgi:hypothetical protein
VPPAAGQTPFCWCAASAPQSPLPVAVAFLTLGVPGAQHEQSITRHHPHHAGAGLVHNFCSWLVWVLCNTSRPGNWWTFWFCVISAGWLLLCSLYYRLAIEKGN